MADTKNKKSSRPSMFTQNAVSKKFSKGLIIVNPNSGNRNGLKALELIKKEIKLEYKIIETTHAGHCLEICRTENLDDIQVIIPIGGDGTVHEAVNGLLLRDDEKASEVSICIMPAGSGNTVAYDLLVDTVEEAIGKLNDGKVFYSDVMKITSPNDTEREPIYAINICGYGLSNSILKRANTLRCCGGGAMYKAGAYAEVVNNKAYACKLEYVDENGETQIHDHQKFLLIQAQNNISTGKKLKFSPTSMMDDGLIELIIINHMSRLKVVNTLGSTKDGTHIDKKGVTVVKCKSFIITPLTSKNETDETTKELQVNVDGEMKGFAPFQLECVPKAISYVI